MFVQMEEKSAISMMRAEYFFTFYSYHKHATVTNLAVHGFPQGL
jgi:hypothetical protein